MSYEISNNYHKAHGVALLAHSLSSINVTLTINAIKVNYKCNTHHRCDKKQP